MYREIMAGMSIKRYGFLLALAAASISGGCNRNTDAPMAPTEPAEPVYVIEGNPVRLDEGVYVGEDGTVSLLKSVSGDLDSDEFEDRTAVLRLDSKGSGIFYYLNVFSGDGEGGQSLVGAEFLGDRIKFDFIQIYGEGSISSLTGVSIHPDDYGQVAVGFSFHAEDQAFSEEPGLYITRHWKVSGGRLVLLENY